MNVLKLQDSFNRTWSRRRVAASITAAGLTVATLSGCKAPHVTCDPARTIDHTVVLGETYFHDADKIGGGNLSEEKRDALVKYIMTLNHNRELQADTDIKLPENGSCHF